MKVRLKRWHGISVWKWEVPGEEVCGICRMPYESCCPGLSVICVFLIMVFSLFMFWFITTGVKFPGDDCPPVWGRWMSSIFLSYCIYKIDNKLCSRLRRNMWARVTYAMHNEVARVTAKCETRVPHVQASMEFSGRLSIVQKERKAEETFVEFWRM